MSFEPAAIPTPQERRERNREEMISAILDAARAIMRDEGAGALNLNKLARRVNLTTPALYSYFENKFAIYDALYRLGIDRLHAYDEKVWNSREPGWECLRAWFESRLAFAAENPDLYQLIYGAPVPGFVPSEQSVAATQAHLRKTVASLTELFDAGVIRPDMPVQRAVDLLLAIRHGIAAERFGKANVVPADSGRFDHLVDDAMEMLRLAWGPGSVDSGGEGGARGSP